MKANKQQKAGNPAPAEQVTDEPVTAEQVTDDPVTAEPVTDDPVKAEPAPAAPVTAEQVTDDVIQAEIRTLLTTLTEKKIKITDQCPEVEKLQELFDQLRYTSISPTQLTQEIMDDLANRDNSEGRRVYWVKGGLDIFIDSERLLKLFEAVDLELQNKHASDLCKNEIIFNNLTLVNKFFEKKAQPSQERPT